MGMVRHGSVRSSPVRKGMANGYGAVLPGELRRGQVRGG
jgi:hypothetical protein